MRSIPPFIILLGIMGILFSCQPSATSLQQNSVVDKPSDPAASDVGMSAPAFASIASAIYIVNNSIGLDINDSSTGDDTDIDGDSITYSCYVDYLVDGLVANILKCTDIGMSFSATSGILNWSNLSSSDIGTYEVKIVGTDDDHAGSVVFDFRVIGLASVSYPGSVSGTVGSAMTISPLSLSDNGSTVINCISTPTLPSGLSLEATTCKITGTPTVANIATNYTIKVTNEAGTSAGIILNITINAASSDPIASLSDNKITINLGSVESAAYPTIIVDTGTKAWSINGLWEDYSSYREEGDFINKNDSDPVWHHNTYDYLWDSALSHWVEVGANTTLPGVDRSYILKDNAHIGKPYSYGLSSTLPAVPATSALITFKQRLRFNPGKYIAVGYSEKTGNFAIGDLYFGPMEDVMISGGTGLPEFAKVMWVNDDYIYLILDDYYSSMTFFPEGAIITGLNSGATATLSSARQTYGPVKFIRAWDDSSIGDNWRVSWTTYVLDILDTTAHPGSLKSESSTLPPGGEWIQFILLHDLNKGRLLAMAFSLESEWKQIFTLKSDDDAAVIPFYAPTISVLGSDSTVPYGRYTEMADISLTQNYLVLLADNNNLLEATKVLPLPIMDQSNGKLIADARNLASNGEYIHIFNRTELVGVYQIGGAEYLPSAPYVGLQESKNDGKVLLAMNPTAAWKITAVMFLSSSATGDPIVGAAADSSHIARYSTQNRLRYRNGSTYCYYNVPAIWDDARHTLVFDSVDGYSMTVSVDGGSPITSTCGVPSSYPSFRCFAAGQVTLHSRKNVYYNFTYETGEISYYFDFVNTLMRNTSLLDQSGAERGIMWEMPLDGSAQL